MEFLACFLLVTVISQSSALFSELGEHLFNVLYDFDVLQGEAHESFPALCVQLFTPGLAVSRRELKTGILPCGFASL